MPVPSSGQVKISDLVAEFGGTAPHAMSEYYRNGGNVPSNNTNVPTSGAFGLSNARGAVNEIAVAATSGTNVDLSSLFGGNWTSTIPKRLTIASGVTIGGTGSSAALIIPSNMAGTLEIDNAGSILGFGGAANSGAGGHAISNSTSGVTINNTGLVAGGGGGGGLGGTGGNGTATVTTTSTRNAVYGGSTWRWTTGSWSGVGSWTHPGGSTSKSFGGHTFQRGSYAGSIGEAAYWTIIGNIVSTVSTTGGSGGSSGIGQGYNISRTLGQAGAAGGTNAGSGGYGGNGGVYGQAGGTGSSGANGNASSGLGGASGGAAGAAVTGTSVTMNNTGTLYGAVA